MRRPRLMHVAAAVAATFVAVFVVAPWVGSVQRARALAAVDLPVIGEAGDLPPKDAIRIGIGADGEPVVDGERVRWNDLVARLDEIEDARRPEDAVVQRMLRRVGLAPPLRRSNCFFPRLESTTDVLLVFDRRTPCFDARRIVSALWWRGMVRIAYAVRTEAGGEPGAFAMFPPGPFFGCLTASASDTTLTVGVRSDVGDPDIDVVARAAARHRASGARRVGVRVTTELHTPVEVMLACAEAARRGGADWFVLDGWTFARAVPAEEARSWRFDVGGADADTNAVTLPSRGRVEGSPGGWFDPLREEPVEPGAK